MTSRERYVRTLHHEPVDRAPRELWPLLPPERQPEVEQLMALYPLDVAAPPYRYGRSQRSFGTQGRTGEFGDAWGCVFRALEDAALGEVVHAPLADWAALDSYQLPWELLGEADFSQVDRFCAETDRFVKVGTETRPFERLQFLRGTETLFYDLAYGVPEVERTLARLHEFFCRELELWARTGVDAVGWMDDWGSQTGLLISPDMWRTLFKPLYREYVSILHTAGKFAFFHSDGMIEAIYPDLVEIGVDAVNSQLFCMDIEGLAQRYGGAITFWGELDRQAILPFGSTGDVRAAVRRVRRAMDHECGGVVAQFEWGKLVPFENAVAAFDEWGKPLSECLAGETGNSVGDSKS